jgi:hypothetical protein
MKISIRQKLRPFSHTPGACCLIPGTTAVVRAFPTRLYLGDEIYPLPFTGPVKGFTLEQDLEKNCVWVYGQAPEGFFRLRIFANDNGFVLKGEKGIELDETLEKEIAFSLESSGERLSLGSHRKLDWDKIRRSNDIASWMPVLFALSQKIPAIPPAHYQFPSSLEALFQGAFDGILVPRFVDTEHQGLIPEQTASGDPAWILQEAGKKIRSLFFEQNERRLSLLPSLPPAFDQGRLIGLKVPGVGTLDLEWSKKLLRRAIFTVATSGEVILQLQNALKGYRVNGKKKAADEPLLLEAGQTYLLDCFQK